MVLLDLLGRRWALRIIWELRDGPETFRSLRVRCDDVSPSVLNTRLRELRNAGIVEGKSKAGYLLTKRGIELLHALKPLSPAKAAIASPRANNPPQETNTGRRSTSRGRSRSRR